MILNVEFNEVVGPSGTRITSVESLHHEGPLVPVTLLPFGRKPGAAQAQPETGAALIDTGARATCVDEAAARRAGIPVVDTGRMNSATHHGEVVPIFAARIDVQGFRSVDAPRAFGANLEPMGIVALIGRDVLRSSILIYNGTKGSFAITG